MSEGKSGNGHGATATLAGGTAFGGLIVGWTADPAKGLELLKWLDGSLGKVGFAIALVGGIAFSMAIAAAWLMWQRSINSEKAYSERLKEKDQECQAELGRQRTAWKAVVDSKESDNREIAKTMSGFLEQVTLLAERARVSNVPTRLP